MSNSSWSDPRITAYVLGELPENELTAFEQELESNAELSAAVDEARNVTGQLESLYAAESVGSLDQQRRNTIATGVRESSDDKDLKQDAPRTIATTKTASSRIPMAVLAIAASIMMLFGIAPWLLKQDQLSTISSLDESEQSTVPKASLGAGESARAEELAKADSSESEMADLEYFPAVQLPTSGQLSPAMKSKNIATAATDAAASKTTPARTGERQDMYRSQVNASADQRPMNEAHDQSRSPPAEIQEVEEIQDLETDAVVDTKGSWQQKEERQASRKQRIAQPTNASGNKKKMSKAITNLAVLPKDESSIDSEEKDLAGQARPMAVKANSPFQASDKTTPATPVPSNMPSSMQSSINGRPLSRAAKVAKETEPGSLSKKKSPMSRKPDDSEGVWNSLSRRRLEARPLHSGGKEDLLRNASGPYGQTVLELSKSTSRGREFSRRLPPRSMSEELLTPNGMDSFGTGPGNGGDKFEPIVDNPFTHVTLQESLSTFSIDVDTASYSKTRDFLARANRLPRPDAVRIEELVNYFDYDYDAPADNGEHPFAATAQITSCPWNKKHRLARIALKGKTMNRAERPPCNLVFLLDTSGSMSAQNKLPLVVEGMKMLIKQLNDKDRVAITVYAGSAGLVLDSTSAKKGKKIRKALTQLKSGGSTNGGEGIALAYQTARDNFIEDGVNRVILCTDGDFNVGMTGTDSLVRMVEQEAKGNIFLSVLGFGMGNHNDSMLEQISGRGNGNYAFIDTPNEARKVLVDQTSGTLVTIAKDVKIQVDFNPKLVSAYRLIGYENRILTAQDFNDDKKDAGEIGAGHTVTALYEIVPVGVESDLLPPKVDPSKYLKPAEFSEDADSGEMLTLKLRYKQPDSDKSTLVDFPIKDEGGKFKDSDDDVRFAAAVAGFGMQLRRSDYSGNWSMSNVIRVAESSKGEDENGLRSEFVELAKKAAELMGQE